MNARYPRFLAVLLSVLLMIGQMTLVTAQDASSPSPYTTVSGQALAWGAPWSFVEDDAMQTSDLDLVFLTDGTATVAVSTGDIFPENARGLVIGFLGGDTNSLQVLDAGASYWFDAFPLDGEPHGAFSVATDLGAGSSSLVMFIGPAARFGEGLANAQAAITLDGEPLLGGVDGMALQAQLGVPADAPAEAALPEFLPVGQWVHEATGVQIAWDGTWFPIGPDGDHAFNLGGARSNILLTIIIVPRDGTTPQDWADEQVRGREDNWGTYTFLPQYVDEDDVLTIGRDVSGQGGIVQSVLFLDDGETVAVVSMAVLNDDPVDAVAAYRASVRIDGRVPLEGVDLDAISGIDVSLYAGVGMVEPGYYVSPQHGVEFRWSKGWQLDPQSSDRVVSDPETRSDTVVIDRIDDEALWISVLIMPSDGTAMDAEVERLATSSNFIQSAYGSGATVVQSGATGDRGALLVRNETASPPTMAYAELYLVNGGKTVVLVSAVTLLQQAEMDIAYVQETVSMNGQPILTFYPVEDVPVFLGQ